MEKEKKKNGSVLVKFNILAFFTLPLCYTDAKVFAIIHIKFHLILKAMFIALLHYHILPDIILNSIIIPYRILIRSLIADGVGISRTSNPLSYEALVISQDLVSYSSSIRRYFKTEYSISNKKNFWGEMRQNSVK